MQVHADVQQRSGHRLQHAQARHNVGQAGACRGVLGPAVAHELAVVAQAAEGGSVWARQCVTRGDAGPLPIEHLVRHLRHAGGTVQGSTD